ncbi:MAG: type II toxin-antitoxin system HicB family antitoxin [Nitrospirae bacterium]|nr:type II toxin-antitoxin system HicB family antitoxin [Magnetococcales bacterium]HAT49559.1 toxin-antitoxin system HicB family antitoxin [Alphaproteobacteria bacterium]
MPALTDYPFEIHPLSGEDGGGYLITFPDFPGCMSDGETTQEAIENGMDALKTFLAVKNRHRDFIPKPGEKIYSGRFVTRVPKTLHARLAIRAKNEGVSMNALVATFLAEKAGESS